jgi:ATP-binding cassette subfamily F protein uup
VAPLIQLTDIALTFGGLPVLTAAELKVEPGDRVCLVGRNGSGKSTLLRIVAGLIEPDGGSRFLQPGIAVRYLPQEPDFSGATTVWSYVETGLGPTGDPYAARYLLEQLGLTGNEDPARLSGGEARRAALVRVLAPSPDVLLLDEPTNHLDLPTIEWLEGELTGRRGALVMISHDRRFLTNLSQSVVWLDRGRTRRLDRGFESFEGWRDDVLETEERDRHKLDRKIVAEEHWLRHGVSGRRKRNMRRVEALQALRERRRSHRGAVGKAELAANSAEASGALVLEAKKIAKAYGERAIVRDLSVRVQRGDRLGIIGPNGSGKTTLVRLLTGALAPDTGALRLGVNVTPATLDQHRESLDPEATVAETLTGGKGDSVVIDDKARHVVSYMKDFLFTADQARTPLKVLSGGERGRLMLARALARPSNLLVLDEPTNDLDLETLDVLQEMLGDYPGTVLLISHDRDFLDRVVGSVLVPEGDGRWTEYAGGYTDMLAQRGTDLARAKPEPTPRQPKAEADPALAPARTKRKLSFNEQHALATLPKTIADLAAQIARLHKVLDDPDLYRRAPDEFQRASASLAQAQAELGATEDRWLELEILRDELGG